MLVAWLKSFEYLVPWLNLAASVLLAGITLWYVAITAKTLRQTQAVDDDRQYRAKREQAAAVAAWVTQSEVNDDRASIQMTLKNPTAQPIYGLELSLVDASAGKLPDGIATPSLLGPGEVRSISTESSIPETASGDLRVEITFIDASGLAWYRKADGTLTQIAQNIEAVHPKPKRRLF